MSEPVHEWLAADEYSIDPVAADLPELSADDFPASNPSDPHDDDHDQDDLEGLGAGGDSPIDPAAALKEIARYISQDLRVDVGYCLKYQRTWRGVGALYQSAKESLYGAPVRHRITDWSAVPRGVIVYFDSPSSKYGHITSSFGGGYVGSTDWPTGRVGRVSGATLQSAWGYTVAYWSPYVNDVKVWAPAADKKPTKPPVKTRGPRVDELIHGAAVLRLAAIKAKHTNRAKHLTAAITELRQIAQYETR